MQTASKQKGAGLFGWVGILAVAGLVVIVGLRIAPMYFDYYTVVSIAEDVLALPRDQLRRKADVQQKIGARFHTNNMRLHARVVQVEYDDNRQLVLNIDYEDRRHMIGNLEVVGTFKRRLQ